MSGTTPPVDLKQIHETSDGDTEFEREIFDVYLKDTAERLDALDAYLKQQIEGSGPVPEDVRRNAHTIKGASANVGAKGMQAIARDLESAVAEGNTAALPVLYKQLRGEFDRVRSFLVDYLKLTG